MKPATMPAPQDVPLVILERVALSVFLAERADEFAFLGLQGRAERLTRRAAELRGAA